jgi:DNA invertase Pin-like site-specific DNA recombinase
MVQKAVLYCRSSKDRADVSIEAQRHQLLDLAKDKGLEVVAEFVDAVESGKDSDRPGFQRLLAEIARRDRAWSTILLLDTSRLARRMAAAVLFEEETCKPRGISVVYKSLPDMDEAERALIKAMHHGVDEWHSLISKRKGLDGMRTNVGNGFRAGGRAPIGYKLEYINTGAVREGRPVLKSRLVQSDSAPTMQRYLKERAAGARREPLAARLGITLAPSSLVGVEWNALTYAGHTVWNVHRERIAEGYAGGTKRRPRAEWVIKRGTHDALISDAEAEAILGRLEVASVKRPRRTKADYLLTGLLRTGDGRAWYGDKQRYYRAGGAHVAMRDVDAAILGKVAQDLRSSAFSRALAGKMKQSYGREFGGEIQRLRAAENAIAGRISGFMDMAAQLETRGPVLRKIDELERDRVRIAAEIRNAQRDAAIAGAAAAVTEHQVGELLDAIAGNMERLDREQLKDFLTGFCDGITLNPDSLTARIHYRIPLKMRNRLASPGASDAIPQGKITSSVRIKRAA